MDERRKEMQVLTKKKFRTATFADWKKRNPTRIFRSLELVSTLFPCHSSSFQSRCIHRTTIWKMGNWEYFVWFFFVFSSKNERSCRIRMVEGCYSITAHFITMSRAHLLGPTPRHRTSVQGLLSQMQVGRMAIGHVRKVASHHRAGCHVSRTRKRSCGGGALLEKQVKWHVR